MSGPRRLALKRRRLGLTDYRLRQKLVLSGKLRLVVRVSNKYIYASIVESKLGGDKVLVSACSKELKKFGWNLSFKNLPSAYLTGVLLAKKASKLGIQEAILDIGLASPTKGNRIFTLAKACNDYGLKVPIGEEVIPDEDRIKGKHIVDYMKQSQSSIQFSRIKSSLKSPEDLFTIFEETLKNIQSEV